MKRKQFSVESSTLITYFIMLLLFICVRIFFLYVELPLSSNASDVVITIFVQIGLMFCFSVLVYSALRKEKPKLVLRQYNYSKIGFKPIILCVLLGFLCYFLNLFVANFFNTIISLFGFENLPTYSSSSATDYSTTTFIVQIFTIAILPAICEETAHRGLLLNGLSRLGVVKALVISSVLFGLMHLSIQQFFYATVLGFIIGLAVVISRSIWPGIIIHFMNNFLSTYFSFANANGWPFHDFTQSISSIIYSGDNIISFFLTSMLVLGVLIMLIVITFASLLKNTRIRKVQDMIEEIKSINQNVEGGSVSDENLLALYTLNQIANQYGGMQNMIFTDLEKKDLKLSGFQKVILIAIIAMGAFVTMSTFVWGVV